MIFEWDLHKAELNLRKQRLLLVAHTERAGRIRIISARQLTRKERKAYAEEIG